MKCPYPRRPHVSKHFGGVQALSKVSLDVHPGEVVALAGDNGAGKSTVIKAISACSTTTRARSF